MIPAFAHHCLVANIVACSRLFCEEGRKARSSPSNLNLSH
jgi:hypothetical protein